MVKCQQRALLLPEKIPHTMDLVQEDQSKLEGIVLEMDWLVLQEDKAIVLVVMEVEEEYLLKMVNIR